MNIKRVLQLASLLAFTFVANAEDKDSCGAVPGGQSPQGGVCAPHEPVVIIVDVLGVPVPIVISPAKRGQDKRWPIFLESTESFQ